MCPLLIFEFFILSSSGKNQRHFKNTTQKFYELNEEVKLYSVGIAVV